MANLVTDIGPFLTNAFPNGRPEMSAQDFQAAQDMLKKISTVSYTGPLDYRTWAHCVVVKWKQLCAEAKKAQQPEPNFLLCPECNVMLVMDATMNDILTCPGGCKRAITMSSFVALFTPKAKPIVPVHHKPQQGAMSGLQALRAMGTTNPRFPKDASIGSSIGPGVDPVEAGIVEKVPPSRKPLTGWRAWRVPHSDPVRLKSISYSHIWEPMVPTLGTCVDKDPKYVDHECPSWHHRCGVYAVKKPEDIDRWTSSYEGSGFVSVMGEIEMRGRVLEYTDGFRAGHAYPLKLYLPSEYKLDHPWSSEELAELLWQEYLTEVVVDDATWKRWRVAWDDD